MAATVLAECPGAPYNAAPHAKEIFNSSRTTNPNKGIDVPSVTEIVNSIGMRLALMPAGEFMMGSDAEDLDAEDDEFLDAAAGRKVKHRVRITRPFYLGRFQVSRGQFRRFVDATAT